MTDIDEALKIVKDAGYVVLKAKSYRQAQERQRVAEVRAQCAAEEAEGNRAWARDCLAEQRRLADRLTFVYGVARAHGASVEELRGPDEKALQRRYDNLYSLFVDSAGFEPTPAELGDE